MPYNHSKRKKTEKLNILVLHYIAAEFDVQRHTRANDLHIDRTAGSPPYNPETRSNVERNNSQEIPLVT